MHPAQFPADTFGTTGGGVAHPFGTPWLIFVDTIRGMLLLLLGWDIVVATRAAFIRHTIPASRAIAVICACWVVAETEADRVGFGVGHGGMLWISVVAFVAFTVNLWQFAPGGGRE